VTGASGGLQFSRRYFFASNRFGSNASPAFQQSSETPADARTIFAQFGAPGLGLPISGHRGGCPERLSAKSRKNQDATFLLRACISPFSNAYLMKSSSRRLRILLVENHEDTLTYLTRYLEQQGHEVCGVCDMASALKATCSSSFDVLISDIGLPDGDGWQLIRQMKPKPFGIAMSGFGARSDCEKSFAAGYKHHLTKPFLPDDLDALLKEAASQVMEKV
jgi:CheY-like chemotaxis protein